MNTTQTTSLLDRWRDAEHDGDALALDQLLAADFVGVGPVGFVLDRATWLSRFDMGLRYEALSLDEVAVHDHDGTAIAVAHQHATGSVGDIVTPPDTRVMFTVLSDSKRGDSAPKIASIQYSFIGPPLGPS